MNNSTLFQFAVNKFGCNKDWNYEILNSKFENSQGTLQNLIDVVSQGYAITASTFKCGTRRAKSNVLGAQLWLLDIDNSDILRDETGKPVKDADGKSIKVYNPQLTIETAKSHPFIQKHCLLAYTSASHKPDWHKFRLVLRLPYFVTDVALVETTARRLMEYLPHDPSCKDASRVFYGNTNANFFIVNPDAEPLPEEWLIEASLAVQQKKIEQEQRSQQRLSWLESQGRSEREIDSLIKEALSFIPPRSPGSGNYQECLMVLMALQNHYGWESEAIAEQWSPSIKGTTWNIGRKLRSFKASGNRKVTLGSLFHIAKGHGFRFPEVRKHQNNFGEPDPALYERYLKQEALWEKIETLKAENRKNEWFQGFCKKVKQRFFARKATKDKQQSDSTGKDSTRKVVRFSADNPLPSPEPYEALEEQPPIFQHAKGERHAAWLAAFQAGWKVVIDRSQPGSGKSHDSGLLNPKMFSDDDADVDDWSRAGVDDSDGNRTPPKLWYLSPGHTNPSVSTVERFTNMMPRHAGMIVDSSRETPLGKPWLRHPTADDQYKQRTPGNCEYANLFTTLAKKGYDVNSDKVLIKSDDGRQKEVNPICANCQHNWKCHEGVGPGYGYKYERIETMGEVRVRAHLGSLPTPGFAKGEHDYSNDVAIIEEAGINLTAVKTVETNPSELAAEWLHVEENAPETFEQLRNFRLALKRVLEGQANDDPRFGANHEAIAKFLPPAPDDIQDLIEQVRKALPSVADLFEKPDSVQGLGGKDKKTGQYIRSKMRQEAHGSFADKVQQLPVSALVDALEIWAGGPGAMRCNNGSLVLATPNLRHAEILGSCKFVVLLDATANKNALAKKLNIDPNQILEIEQEPQPLTNLRVINVNVAGLGSSDISDAAKQRVLALINHIDEKHQTQSPVIALKKDKAWLKERQSGYWFSDSRGTNKFQGEQVLISINTPRINVGAAQDEYRCLHGSLDNFDEYYRGLTQVEQEQCQAGRQRAALEPEREFIHYSIGTNQNLDFLAEKYGCVVENVESVELCPQAATKGEQSRLRIVQAATQLLDAGAKLTQTAIGELADMSQAAISKVAARFGEWKRFKKLLLVLTGLYRDGYIFARDKNGPPPDLNGLSEDERFLALEFLPGLAEPLSGKNLADELTEVSQIFDAESLGRILHFTPHWVKTKLLVAVLGILPRWARDEFLSSTNMELLAT